MIITHAALAESINGDIALAKIINTSIRKMKIKLFIKSAKVSEEIGEVAWRKAVANVHHC